MKDISLSSLGHPHFLRAVFGDICRLMFLRYPHLSSEFSPFCFLLTTLSPLLYPNYIYRLSVLLHFRQFSFISALLCRLNILLFGIEISPRCIIGPGVLFPHPMGTIIGSYYIGANATIYHGVTLGCKRLSFEFSHLDRPCISDNVILGCGSTVLGGVFVGKSSIISANCMVTCDIPSFTIVKSSPIYFESLVL
jgi:serine O-acetyltransferase